MRTDLSEAEKEKTKSHHIASSGHYKYLVMLYGLANAPFAIQAEGNQALLLR